eukprot:3369897-Prymnesium_polylepis.1
MKDSRPLPRRILLKQAADTLQLLGVGEGGVVDHLTKGVAHEGHCDAAQKGRGAVVGVGDRQPGGRGG